MERTHRNILISISGQDKPGITAGLTRLISALDANLIDIEQVVTRSLLSLSMIVSLDSEKNHQDLIKELLFKAHELDVRLTFHVLEEKELKKHADKQNFVITCLGEEVGSKVIAKLSGILYEEGINIEKIGKLTQ